MKIYIAAPLFNEGERAFNLKLARFLEGLGLETYLPQRDAGILSDIIASGVEESAARRQVFEADVAAMEAADAILVLLDGRTVDEGACFEFGYMFARGKPCYGFQTDARSFLGGKPNLMLDHALIELATSWEELRALAAKFFK